MRCHVFLGILRPLGGTSGNVASGCAVVNILENFCWKNVTNAHKREFLWSLSESSHGRMAPMWSICSKDNSKELQVVKRLAKRVSLSHGPKALKQGLRNQGGL